MTVRTRIAPSPTGYLHFGLARTALFCYLYARKRGGTYVLRIEDTDTARNKPEYEADIKTQLSWLGLSGDEEYRQSEHRARHTECLRKLIAEDKAYVSREPAKDDPSREVEVIRLRNPGEHITFTDSIRGELSFDTTDLGDFVIARSIDEPLFHMAVVVDDHDEGVTHVIRGEDHISNTPRHILLQRALGFPTPEYAHLPLILMPDRSKMSKRTHESSVMFYREHGFLPQALINYLALLGWNPGGDRELFDLDALVEHFDLTHVQKAGAVFDMEKLRWFNRQYLLALPEAESAEAIFVTLKEAVAARGLTWNEKRGQKLVPMVKERISVWGDIRALAEEGELDFFFAEPALDASQIPGKGNDAAAAIKHLEALHEMLDAVESFDDPVRLKDVVWEYATNEGRGAVLWPLRYGLSGKAKSPDPFMIASILGKEVALTRIKAARAALS